MKAARIALALGCLSAPASAQSLSVADVFDLLCGRTIQFYDTGVGNQIEFSDADGNAYLWFNQTAQIMEGTWEVFETETTDGTGYAVQVCYEYRLDAFGLPDEREVHCHDAETWLGTIAQAGVFHGDRYGLRDGTPPFLLREHPFQPLDELNENYPELPPERNCGVPVS